LVKWSLGSFEAEMASPKSSMQLSFLLKIYIIVAKKLNHVV
jgi:hypothetical protein